MATMWKAAMATKEFAWELEWHARDVGMAKEDTKVHLVLALSQDTFTRLDAYVTMHGGNKMAGLETIQDWLHCVPYIQMLAYLQQSKLRKLAR